MQNLQLILMYYLCIYDNEIIVIFENIKLILNEFNQVINQNR